MSDDDATDEARTSSRARVTIRLGEDVEKMRRTLNSLLLTLAEVRSQMEVPAAQFAEMQQRMTEAVRPFLSTVRRFQARMDQHSGQWTEAAEVLRRIVDVAAAANERFGGLQLAFDGSALESVRIAAEHHAELRATLQAVLKANQIGAGSIDAGSAADRIIDEVVRPADPAPGEDVLTYVAARVCAAGEALGLSRGQVVVATVMILIGIAQCRFAERDRSQIEARLNGRQERIREEVVEHRRATGEEVDAILDRLDAIEDEVRARNCAAKTEEVRGEREATE